MTLQQLKEALDAALEASLKDPKDEALKKAADDAQKAYDDAKAAADAAGGGEGGSDDDSLDENSLDEKTKKYLAKLRKENAGHRTANKDLKSRLKADEEKRRAILKAAGIELEDDEPEEKIKKLDQTNNQLAFRNAILESAVQHGIPGDQVEYYEFLVGKATQSLDEGDELSDEALAAIVAKVKKLAKGGAGANTSVTNPGGEGDKTPAGSGSGQVTLDQFCRMSMVQKSDLFTKNRALYDALMVEAKAKKKLV